MALRRISEYEDNSSDVMSDATNDGPPPKPSRKFSFSTTSENSEKVVRRRGRGPSKKPCLNRNALMARENRERKKKYVEHLEEQLHTCTERTEQYKNIIQKKTINERRLKAEVTYLRNVLNNSTGITSLLQSLNESLSQNKRNSKQMNSSSIQRDSHNFFEGEMKPFLENSKSSNIEGDNNLVHNMNYDTAEPERIHAGKILDESIKPSSLNYDHNYTSPLLSPGEGPFLSSFSENFDNQQPFTPLSMVDSMVDNMDLVSSLTNSNSMDLFENGGLHMDNDLNFETLPLFEDDCHQYQDNTANTAGICLHINPNRVSLEFCSSCQMNNLHSGE